MKKVFLAICIAAISSVSYGQKGTNAIGIGADVNIPMGDFGDAAKTGFGGYAKLLYGIGEAGSLTLTTGYSTHKAKGEEEEGVKTSTNIIPLLLGYRHNFSGFYVEPQVGYASYAFKAKSDDVDFAFSFSKGGLAYALGIGYVISNFDIGVRYQGGSVKFMEGAEKSDFSFVGIRVGYNINLGGSK